MEKLERFYFEKDLGVENIYFYMVQRNVSKWLFLADK